jgi:hypothetical protein
MTDAAIYDFDLNVARTGLTTLNVQRLERLVSSIGTISFYDHLEVSSSKLPGTFKFESYLTSLDVGRRGWSCSTCRDILEMQTDDTRMPVNRLRKVLDSY